MVTAQRETAQENTANDAELGQVDPRMWRRFAMAHQVWRAEATKEDQESRYEKANAAMVEEAGRNPLPDPSGDRGKDYAKARRKPSANAFPPATLCVAWSFEVWVARHGAARIIPTLKRKRLHTTYALAENSYGKQPWWPALLEVFKAYAAQQAKEETP